MNSEPMRIDVDKVLRTRLPRHYRYIPRFAVRWLERTICQDQLNAIILKMAGKNSVDAASAARRNSGIQCPHRLVVHERGCQPARGQLHH